MCIDNKVLFDGIKKTSNKIAMYIEKHLSDRVEVSIIKAIHSNKKNAPEWTKKGSYIYFLYNKSHELIYIGETGVRIKARLFTNGDGAHCKKGWFSNVQYVRYYKDDNMDRDTRKMIERALILEHRINCKLYNND